MKPERIQMGLRNLPGWLYDEDTTSLVRQWQFPAVAVAAKYSSFLAELAEAHGVIPRIELHGDTVTLVLPGGSAGVSEQTFEHAQLLQFGA